MPINAVCLSRYIIAGLLLPVLSLAPAFAQRQGQPPLSTAVLPLKNDELTDYKTFRAQLTSAVAQAEAGDKNSAAKTIEAAVSKNATALDLPKLSTVLSDKEVVIPAAQLENDAVRQGVPYWLLAALVRLGDADGAKRIAHSQKEPESVYRALCLIAVSQSGRALNASYMLPPVVKEAPATWTAPATLPGGKTKAAALQITNIGEAVAPLLDCRALRVTIPTDTVAAYATLQEAREALAPTKTVDLYRELAEVQGKMGDKAGATVSVQTAAELAVAEWNAAQKDPVQRDLSRSQISLLATDLEALGDKENAKRLRSLLSANAFQKVGLPIFLTVNAGAIAMFFILRHKKK